MKVLFVDPCCPKPYDSLTLANDPLGGTEATVIRVAEALAASAIAPIVCVKQHNRKECASGNYGTGYVPFGFPYEHPSHVVVLRAPQALLQARKQFPSAKLFFWAHDMFVGNAWAEGFKTIIETQAVPIVVSDWHRSQMYDAMRQFEIATAIPCKRIYNPIDDDLKPDATASLCNKLVFFSSPHKGLKHTLEVFKRFKDFEELEDVTLCIANPGYFDNHNTEGMHNVINLGAISHGEVIQHVRSALAVFHLNSVFPETFGLVHAEANAVGTPFLSSRLGATHELQDHPAELIDVMDSEAVIKRIIEWKTRGRPRVRGNPEFRMSRIVKEWIDLFSR